jgi:RNA polymerase-binding transcription factor DksA
MELRSTLNDEIDFSQIEEMLERMEKETWNSLGSTCFNEEERESLKRAIRQLREARQRIRDGSYGICKVCKSGIPINRIKAHPVAETCVECHRR